MDNTLYEYVVEMSGGHRVTVDLWTRTMKVNGEVVVDRGRVADKYAGRPLVPDGAEEALEDIFGEFYDSVPDGRRDRNFLVRDSDTLSVADLASGRPRGQARAKLEGLVLLLGMAGRLEGLLKGRKFWRSERNGSFVIWREWALQSPA